jgi:hypothetical protein
MPRIGNKPPSVKPATPKKPAAKPSTPKKPAQEKPGTGGWKPKPGSKPSNRPLE